MPRAAPKKIDRTTKYAKEVLARNIIAGELVKKTCQRHMDDLKKSRRKSFEFSFDQDAADRAIEFFSFLQHSKGSWAGQPIKLELWQCFVVGSIFGWKKKN